MPHRNPTEGVRRPAESSGASNTKPVVPLAFASAKVTLSPTPAPPMAPFTRAAAALWDAASVPAM